MAADYLRGLGYEIIGRNIREKFGEIDILAKSRDGAIHFVEVKTISADAAEATGMDPEDYLRRGKIDRMKRMAGWYMGLHSELSGSYQLDLVAIKAEEGSAAAGKSQAIKLYTNLC